MANYQTRHIRDECNCLDVSIPVEEMTRIVTEGDVPLVSIHPQAHGIIDLCVSRATNATDYVAFSHVWSNGLGNPQGNSLPQCQLEYFADAFVEAGWDRARLFWIDTLCIPINQAALKTKAINQMGLIYSAASSVFVLDAELQQIRVSETADHSHMLALQAHILTSAWMGRSWTLQEGALAKACSFAFADGIQHMRSSLPDLERYSLATKKSNGDRLGMLSNLISSRGLQEP
ncbi:hypothetical protein W97_05490 [Coniosporium apollinis CBS 100218]|uniref:Heterokaryon incompatibility domain-containing protein n=1 Tax=Coniosporium apollinis (strain CBS 100218) TaxID=1168221 RepID=R7YX23_CONA1|nr:uncharacterized protein W97_05490 [Coniosporium apollinis CBS 100218]EON66393.1 hypothetical protein W97_05490 [Coniosporium apollinis CBS 100218]